MLHKEILNVDIDLVGKAGSFSTAEPFPHIVLDDFLADEVISQICRDFVEYDDYAWYTYSNSIENKKALNNWNIFPPLLYRLFSQLNSDSFLLELQALSGIQKLYADPGLHGGGLHAHSRGGKLNIHLDYSIHPKLKLERRLNLLIYVTPDWQPEWGGGVRVLVP